MKTTSKIIGTIYMAYGFIFTPLYLIIVAILILPLSALYLASALPAMFREAVIELLASLGKLTSDHCFRYISKGYKKLSGHDKESIMLQNERLLKELIELRKKKENKNER